MKFVLTLSSRIKAVKCFYRTGRGKTRLQKDRGCVNLVSSRTGATNGEGLRREGTRHKEAKGTGQRPKRGKNGQITHQSNERINFLHLGIEEENRGGRINGLI